MHNHKRATQAQSNSTQSGAAPGDEESNTQLVSAAAIRLYAFRKWEIAGKPTGDGVQFWLEAEQELVPKKQAASTHDHSQDADRHSKTRHPHSQK